ncbi:MAG: hypothetical protein LC127_17730 [Chitinophagales bacterium]|nr:hypothetical protein [Chitinophagales bacterium]
MMECSVKYIYDYSLGMQTERVIEIKELDADFWDRMRNEEPVNNLV